LSLHTGGSTRKRTLEIDYRITSNYKYHLGNKMTTLHELCGRA